MLPSSLRIAVYSDPTRDAATLKVDIASTESTTVWLTNVLGLRRQIAEIPHGSGCASHPGRRFCIMGCTLFRILSCARGIL